MANEPSQHEGPGGRLVQKVVGYVVHDSRLLVFTHDDDVALAIAGVQVPAGTLEAGESPAEAVVREVLEETGRRTFVVRDLGVEWYDAWPAKDEVHGRRFFQLERRADPRSLERRRGPSIRRGCASTVDLPGESADMTAPTPPGR